MGLDSTSTDQTVGIVSGQRVDLDMAAPTAGVDELAVAHVDAHMAHPPTPHGVEEDQIARLQIGVSDLLADPRLLATGSR